MLSLYKETHRSLTSITHKLFLLCLVEKKKNSARYVQEWKCPFEVLSQVQTDNSTKDRLRSNNENGTQ